MNPISIDPNASISTLIKHVRGLMTHPAIVGNPELTALSFAIGVLAGRAERLEAAVDGIAWTILHTSAEEIYDASKPGPAEVVSVKSLHVVLDSLDAGWRDRVK